MNFTIYGLIVDLISMIFLGLYNSQMTDFHEKETVSLWLIVPVKIICLAVYISYFKCTMKLLYTDFIGAYIHTFIYQISPTENQYNLWLIYHIVVYQIIQS